MTTHILTPFLGVNDEEAILLEWNIVPGQLVKSNDVLCQLETTKAVIDVQSEGAGYFFKVVDAGQSVKVGEILGLINNDKSFDVDAYLDGLKSKEILDIKVTKKAEILIVKNKLNYSSVKAFADGKEVNEELVRAFLENQMVGQRRVGIGEHAQQRVGILGGVSGGGALIVVDAISRMANMRAVRIYDKDPLFHGNRVAGIPIIGGLDRLIEDFNFGHLDAVVIAFNRNLQERHSLYLQLTDQGIPFTNVIDPSVDIRSGVEMGSGNIILGHVYIGAYSVIGNNNFISANVALEHGNTLGSSCAFGPGVFTSGNIKVGDRVRFGAGVFIEPSLIVGDDSVIGSGRILVTNISARSVLTSRATS